MAASSAQVTKLLHAWRQGEDAALHKLLPLVHQELRRLARRYMHGERPGHTLQPTALVNEAYVRMLGAQKVNWQNRAHFFAISAQLMRRILVDSARARAYQKRGGNATKITLDEALIKPKENGRELLTLDDALKALDAADPRKGKVVELRFFGGLTVEETAEVLNVSPETVHRDWKFAKAWLQREMSKDKAEAKQSSETDRQ